MTQRPTVLFVCVKNGGKSPMAAGLTKKAAGDTVTVTSAGTKPGTAVNALSAESLQEVGIDITHETPKALTPEMVAAATVMVTLAGTRRSTPSPGPGSRTGTSTGPPTAGSTASNGCAWSATTSPPRRPAHRDPERCRPPDPGLNPTRPNRCPRPATSGSRSYRKLPPRFRYGPGMATAGTTTAARTTAAKRSSARKPKPSGHLVGYARVSTAEQDPALQLDALELAGCARVFTDHASGSREDRPQLAAALDHVRSGDTLVVWRLDRLGRSLPHLIDTVTALADRKVGFRSVTEAIDTTTAGGRLVFHLFGALAEFERQLIRDRTLAGLAAARARGRVGGRPRTMTEAKLRLARAMRAQTPPMSLGAIAVELGLAKSTVARNLSDAEDQDNRGERR